MTRFCAVRGQLQEVRRHGSAPKPLVRQSQKKSVLVVWQTHCFRQCIFLQDSRAPAKSRDAGRDDRKRDRPDGVEQEDKQAKLAKIQCYKCKKFGHYATKCPNKSS